MYLGSRPAASVARWTARSDVAPSGILVPDCYVGWPVNHGQPVKHHVRSHCVAASSSLLDDVTLESKSNSPLTCSQDFTDYHRWPKSEFELAAEENSVLDSYSEDIKVACQDAEMESTIYQSKNRNLDNMTGTSSHITRSIQRSCYSDNDMALTEDEGESSSNRINMKPFQIESPSSSLSDNAHLIRAACNSEGRKFLETELVYNPKFKTLNCSTVHNSRNTPTPVATPTTQTSISPVPASSRRRVHPIGKFADELVIWMPHVESSSDEEREYHHEQHQNSSHDRIDHVADEECEELEHCSNSRSNVSTSNSLILPVKRTKRSSRISRHQSKRKRISLTKAIHQQRRQQQQPAQDQKGKDGPNRRRKQHNPWTVEETKMLIKGVGICGEGKWADIKRLEFKELESRSPVDLKDKWRNLLRLAQLTQHHPRARKVEKRTDLPSELLTQVRKLGTQQK